MKLNQLSLLIEARSNPHLNKKTSSVRQLRQLYENDPIPSSLFVTFSNVNKLGINPSTIFSTPNGIYSYRLSYILDNLYDDNSSLVTSRPFPDDNVENVIVFRLVNSQNVHNTKDQITNDVLQKLKEISKENTHYQNMFHSLIYGGKSSQTFGNIWYDVYKYIKSDKMFTDEDASSNSSSRVRFRSDLKDTTEYSLEARTALTIFRKLGIDGFIDDGDEIIHENEPNQAVFFNSRVLKVIKHLQDQRYKLDIQQILPVNTKKQVEYINNNILINDQLPHSMIMFYMRKVDKWLETHILEIYNDVDFLSVYGHYNVTLSYFKGLIAGAKTLNDDQKEILCHHLEVVLRGTDAGEKVIKQIKGQIP